MSHGCGPTSRHLAVNGPRRVTSVTFQQPAVWFPPVARRTIEHPERGTAPLPAVSRRSAMTKRLSSALMPSVLATTAGLFMLTATLTAQQPPVATPPSDPKNVGDLRTTEQ